jgi:helix-turn-helix protein
MSQNEEPLIDKQGKFLQVVKRGRKRTDVGWIPGRILLSEKRLVLAASEGKRTVPVKDITEIGSRFDVNQNVARVAEYTAVRYDDDDNVLLITASSDPEEIEQGFYQALLDSESVLIRHPAVEGGVVQDTDWCRGQLKYDDDSVVFGLSNGTFAEIELDDIGGFNTAKQMVQEEHRTVLKVEHTREEGISIQTHVTGTGQHVQVLTSLLERVTSEARSASNSNSTNSRC